MMKNKEGYLILADNNVIEEAVGLIGSILKNAPKRIHLVTYNVAEEKLESIVSCEYITIERLEKNVPGSYHHLALQLQVYNRSPFENTLYIDTDMFVMQNIDHIFEVIDKIGYFICSDWDQHWMKAKTFSRTYPKIWDIYDIPSSWDDLPMFNAGLIGYKKTNLKIGNILQSIRDVDFKAKDIFTDQCFMNYFFRREFGEHLLFFSDHVYNCALVNQKEYNPQLRRTIIHHHVRKTKNKYHSRMQIDFQNFFYEEISRPDLKKTMIFLEKKIMYFFKNGRLSRQKSEESYPKEMFYGADRLSNVIIKESENIGKGKGLFRLLDRLFNLQLFTFSDLFKLFKIRGNHNLIASISISMSAMQGLLNKLFLSNKKSICFSMSAYYQNFNRIERKIFRWVEKDTVFISISRYDYKMLQDKLRPTNHYLLEFGVDTDFWRAGFEEADGEYYLSIGMDKSRDWDLLIEVFKGRKEKLIIINNKKYTDLPSNIKHINGSFYKNGSLSDIDIKEYYKNSKAVIIPLIETGQPSGQSVCLQAMAMKKAVIITDNLGLWSGKLKNKENVLLVSEKNHKSMEDAIDYIEDNKEEVNKIINAAYSLVLENYTYDSFVKKLKVIIEKEVYR